MAEFDISTAVPPTARWVKVHYEITAKKPGAQLIARFWSGELKDPVVVQGASGEAFVRLHKPQSLSFQYPALVDLKVKIVAYKDSADLEPPEAE